MDQVQETENLLEESLKFMFAIDCFREVLQQDEFIEEIQEAKGKEGGTAQERLYSLKCRTIDKWLSHKWKEAACMLNTAVAREVEIAFETDSHYMLEMMYGLGFGSEGGVINRSQVHIWISNSLSAIIISVKRKIEQSESYSCKTLEKEKSMQVKKTQLSYGRFIGEWVPKLFYFLRYIEVDLGSCRLRSKVEMAWFTVELTFDYIHKVTLSIYGGDSIKSSLTFSFIRESLQKILDFPYYFIKSVGETHSILKDHFTIKWSKSPSQEKVYTAEYPIARFVNGTEDIWNQFNPDSIFNLYLIKHKKDKKIAFISCLKSCPTEAVTNDFAKMLAFTYNIPEDTPTINFIRNIKYSLKADTKLELVNLSEHIDKKIDSWFVKALPLREKSLKINYKVKMEDLIEGIDLATDFHANPRMLFLTVDEPVKPEVISFLNQSLEEIFKYRLVAVERPTHFGLKWVLVGVDQSASNSSDVHRLCFEKIMLNND